jgi:5-methylcytosine-specific restriction endonuclease McrA
MTKKRSEEYKAKHRIREAERYWEKHKDDTSVCKICGVTYLKMERRGTTKTCSEGCSSINKKMNDKNRDKEKLVEYRKEYHIANREKRLEYQKSVRQSEIGKKRMAIQDAKPHRRIAKTLQYQARRAVFGNGKQSVEESILNTLGVEAKCNFCGTEEELCVDHMTPLSRGGTNTLDNLQILCRPCNSSKSNKTMEEFLVYMNIR